MKKLIKKVEGWKCGVGKIHCYDAWNFIRNGYEVTFADGGTATLSAGYLDEPDVDRKTATLGINTCNSSNLSPDDELFLDSIVGENLEDFKFETIVDEEWGEEPDINDKEVDGKVEILKTNMLKTLAKNMKKADRELCFED